MLFSFHPCKATFSIFPIALFTACLMCAQDRVLLPPCISRMDNGATQVRSLRRTISCRIPTLTLWPPRIGYQEARTRDSVLGLFTMQLLSRNSRYESIKGLRERSSMIQVVVACTQSWEPAHLMNSVVDGGEAASSQQLQHTRVAALNGPAATDCRVYHST